MQHTADGFPSDQPASAYQPQSSSDTGRRIYEGIMEIAVCLAWATG
ncbi:hypothetical protein N9B17_01360 [Rhodopirellula sp.]|nr:hypothetical protein [Rhodopirellula sp.]